jgi:hypothetical protein
MGCLGEYYVSGILGAFVGGSTTAPLAVAASNVSRAAFGPASSGTVTSVALPNTTITGGVAPYTVAWTNEGGDNPTISSSTAVNPTWSQALVPFDEPNVSTQRVTVTDAVSATATADITVTLTWVQI